MRKLAAGIATMVALALTAAPAGAAPSGGIPGSSNCRGQTISTLNHEGHAVGLDGFSKIAADAGLTVQEAQQAVDAFCSASPGI